MLARVPCVSSLLEPLDSAVLVRWGSVSAGLAGHSRDPLTVSTF